jgi:cobalt-zinc-cadmium efflux system outer membrane protein
VTTFSPSFSAAGLATVLLCVLSPARSDAQATGSRPDLPAIVAAALRGNLDLATARLRVDSALAEGRVARAIPNPTVSGIPNVPYQWSVVEPLDLGPQRIYRTRAAGRGAAAAALDSADQARQVVFAARQGYFDLLLAEALRGVAVEQRDLVRQLLAGDSARVRSGDIPARNLVTSEVQLARADAAVARADAGVRGARIALQLLLGVRQPDTAFAVSGELRYRPVDVPVDSLALVAATSRPDLLAARARVEQSRALRSFAQSQLIPTPTVNATYQSGQPFGNGRQYELGFGLTVPVFYWFGGERQRARAGEAAAAVQAQRVEAQLSADLVAALDAERATRALAERYESELLAKSAQALETARYAYRSGAASQLELLDAIRAWTDTRTDYYTAVHDYWVSVYALDRAAGKDLIP